MAPLPPWLHALLHGLERSGIGEFVRTTPFLYPVLMGLHVLGIALLIGPALAVDLRFLGIARRSVPVTVVATHLLPLCHLGFAVVASTGLLMLCAIALAVGASSAAPWKAALILTAGLNILVFHRGIYRSVDAWNLEVTPPLRAKVAALVSAVSWCGTVFAGRFLAY